MFGVIDKEYFFLSSTILFTSLLLLLSPVAPRLRTQNANNRGSSSGFHPSVGAMPCYQSTLLFWPMGSRAPCSHCITQQDPCPPESTMAYVQV